MNFYLRFLILIGVLAATLSQAEAAPLCKKLFVEPDKNEKFVQNGKSFDVTYVGTGSNGKKVSEVAKRVQETMNVKTVYSQTHLDEAGAYGQYSRNLKVGFQNLGKAILLDQKSFQTDLVGHTYLHEIGHAKTDINFLKKGFEPLAIRFLPKYNMSHEYTSFQADEPKQTAYNLRAYAQNSLSAPQILKEFKQREKISVKELFPFLISPSGLLNKNFINQQNRIKNLNAREQMYAEIALEYLNDVNETGADLRFVYRKHGEGFIYATMQIELVRPFPLYTEALTDLMGGNFNQAKRHMSWIVRTEAKEKNINFKVTDEIEEHIKRATQVSYNKSAKTAVIKGAFMEVNIPLTEEIVAKFQNCMSRQCQNQVMADYALKNFKSLNEAAQRQAAVISELDERLKWMENLKDQNLVQPQYFYLRGLFNKLHSSMNATSSEVTPAD